VHLTLGCYDLLSDNALALTLFGGPIGVLITLAFARRPSATINLKRQTQHASRARKDPT